MDFIYSYIKTKDLQIVSFLKGVNSGSRFLPVWPEPQGEALPNSYFSNCKL